METEPARAMGRQVLRSLFCAQGYRDEPGAGAASSSGSGRSHQGLTHEAAFDLFSLVKQVFKFIPLAFKHPVDLGKRPLCGDRSGLVCMQLHWTGSSGNSGHGTVEGALQKCCMCSQCSSAHEWASAARSWLDSPVARAQI